MRTAVTDRIIAEIAVRQHGVVTIEQMKSMGIDPSAVRRRVARESLRRVAPGVYVVGAAPSTWRQRALVHCLTAGPSALLSHKAAAMAWGLEVCRSAPFTISVDRHRRRRSRPNVTIHECTNLRADDRSAVDRLPVTAVPRTLIDLAAVLHPFRVEQALDEALARRLTTLSAVTDRFVAMPTSGHKGTGTIRELLERRTDGYVPTHSQFEAAVRRLVVGLGLPEPRAQVAVDIGDTTVFIDLGWPELLVGIECDGMFFHARTTRLPWDEQRQNELLLRGWMLLRVTWQQYQHDRATFAQQVVTAFRAAEERRLRS